MPWRAFWSVCAEAGELSDTSIYIQIHALSCLSEEPPQAARMVGGETSTIEAPISCLGSHVAVYF